VVQEAVRIYAVGYLVHAVPTVSDECAIHIEIRKKPASGEHQRYFRRRVASKSLI